MEHREDVKETLDKKMVFAIYSHKKIFLCRKDPPGLWKSISPSSPEGPFSMGTSYPLIHIYLWKTPLLNTITLSYPHLPHTYPPFSAALPSLLPDIYKNPSTLLWIKTRGFPHFRKPRVSL
jgi:hypothetical protein